MKEAVYIYYNGAVGFIEQHYIGGALVSYDFGGIATEEFLTDEDFMIIEEWEN